MTIGLRIHSRLGAVAGSYSGATADVFNVDGVACKLFRVYGVAHPPDGVRRRFESEVEAHRRAGLDPWLALHIARFLGPCAVDKVTEADGTSVAHLYALDSCYQLELLAGSDQKLTTPGLRESFVHLRAAQVRFTALGIDVLDASVFNAEDAEAFKFIDFRLRTPRMR